MRNGRLSVVTVSLAVAAATPYLIAATRIEATAMQGCVVDFRVDERQQNVMEKHGIHVAAFDDGVADKLYVSSSSYWENGVITLTIAGTRSIEVPISALSSSSALITVGDQFSAKDIELESGSYGAKHNIEVVQVKGIFK